MTTIQFETTKCPLCGSEQERELLIGCDNLYGVPGEFRLSQCRRCRHVYMNPRPTLETIGKCYPSVYGPHRRSEQSGGEDVSTEAEASRAWYLSPWARRIPGLRRLYYWLVDTKGEYIPPISDEHRRALEIGCATGRFLVRLRDEGWEALGVEMTEEPARQAADNGFDVYVGTLESAAFSEASFDAVFAWHVIEHLPDPKRTLREVHRVLKPGGCFAFSVPNFACWERLCFGRSWHALELPRHLQHFTPRTLRNMLDETGFDSVKILYQRSLLNVVGSIGIVLRRQCPRATLGQQCIDFTEQPTMWPQLALAPLAKFLAFIRQSGRLTVITRRRP